MSWPLQWIAETAIVATLMLAASSLRSASAPLRYVLLVVALLKFAVPPTLIDAPVAIHLTQYAVAGDVAEKAADPLLLIWIAGATIVFLSLLVRFVRLQLLAARSATVTDREISELFARTAREIGVRRVPRLLVNDDAPGAISFGVLRPRVLITPLLLGSDRETLRVIFAHELAHHRRLDLWVGHVQTWLAVLWWFDPLFLLLSRRMHAIREEACDDFLLARRITTSDDYCSVLLRTASELRRQSFAIPASAMADPRVSLERRVRRIMAADLSRRDRVGIGLRLALLTLAAVLLPGYVSSTTIRVPSPAAARTILPPNAAIDAPEPAMHVARIARRPRLNLKVVPRKIELAAPSGRAETVAEDAVSSAVKQYVVDEIRYEKTKPIEKATDGKFGRSFGRLFRSIFGSSSPSPSASPSPSPSPSP